MDWNLIRDRIKKLSQREWPAEWGPDEETTIGDFYGWCHRYHLQSPLVADELATFESQHRIVLPEDYRQFLNLLGNGGAGPAYGIFALGQGEEEPLPEAVLANLRTGFALNERWNDTALLAEPEHYYGYQLLAGAMPIATHGCALDYWLIVSGPRKGEIWFDKRTDGRGVEPVCEADGRHMTFGNWYTRWLEDVCRKHGVS